MGSFFGKRDHLLKITAVAGFFPGDTGILEPSEDLYLVGIGPALDLPFLGVRRQFFLHMGGYPDVAKGSRKRWIHKNTSGRICYTL